LPVSSVRLYTGGVVRKPHAHRDNLRAIHDDFSPRHAL
jgi:hypothetical protein